MLLSTFFWLVKVLLTPTIEKIIFSSAIFRFRFLRCFLVCNCRAFGDWKLVEAMSLAAIAAGADGLIIEVHACPECAWSDGAQSLKPAKFASLIEKGRAIAKVIGREL